MKLVVLRNNLKRALDVVSRAVGSNANLPIISSVLLKTVDGKLKVVATNLEVGVTNVISAKIIEDGGIGIPFSVLSNIVSNVSSERINLETKNNNLLVNTDNYEASIQGVPEGEFPIIPKLKEIKEGVEINAQELNDALIKVVIAGSTNDLRPEINGVLFIIESAEIKLVATDSFRLAEARIGSGQFKNHLNEGARVIVPLKTAEIISKISGENNGGKSVKVFFESNQILLKTDDIEVVSRVVDGNFPDYEAILPKETNTEVIVDRSELINALKLAGSFTLKAKDVKLKIKNEKVLEVYSSDSSLGENKYLIPAKTKGGDAESVFNVKYLLDGVKAEDSETVSLGINDENKPTVIKTPSNDKYLYILMPVKV